MKTVRHLTQPAQSGQSILEVLFATTVVALVLVAILSTIITSVRNARTASEQSQATTAAQETLEWFRHQRDLQGWSDFRTNLPTVGETRVYCLATFPDSITTLGTKIGVCDEVTIPGTPLIRQASLQRLSDAEVDIIVSVTRPARSGLAETLLTGRLTEWQ